MQTSPRARRIAVMLAALAVAGLLAACAAVPLPLPTDDPAPSPTPTVAPVDAPTPRLDAGCADLLPDTLWASVLPAAIMAEPLQTAFPDAGPDRTALAQLGAVTCVRGADPFLSGEYSETRLMLTVVPDAAEAWQRYRDVYAEVSEPSPYGTDALGPRCWGFDGFPGAPGCEFQGFFNGYWVDLWAYNVEPGGVTDAAGMALRLRPATDAIVAILEAQGPLAPRWEVPAGTRAIPTPCDAIVTAAEVEAVTGVTGLYVGEQWDGPRVGQYFYGLTETGASRCSFGFTDSDSGIGALAHLPGGEWALRDRAEALIAAGGVATPVAGLASDDLGILRCTDATQECILDLSFGGSWLRISILPNGAGGLPEGLDLTPARANIVAIAEVAIASIAV